MAEIDDIGYSANNFVQSGGRKKNKRKEERKVSIYANVINQREGRTSQLQQASFSGNASGKTGCPWCRWFVLVASVILLAVFITLRVHYAHQQLESLKTEISVLTNNLEEQRRLCNGTSANMTPLQTNGNWDTRSQRAETGCAPGWRYFNGKCYYFSTEERNWHQSRDACVTMGGHLVIIETQEEQGFLSQQGSEQYWIGLSDHTEGEWRWVDNSLLNDNTKYWNEKEPNDWKGPNDEYPSGEDCARMLINGNIRAWFDVFCRYRTKCICESKAAIVDHPPP